MWPDSGMRWEGAWSMMTSSSWRRSPGNDESSTESRSSFSLESCEGRVPCVSDVRTVCAKKTSHFRSVAQSTILGKRKSNGYRTDSEWITHGSIHSIPFHFTYYVRTSTSLPARVIDKYLWYGHKKVPVFYKTTTVQCKFLRSVFILHISVFILAVLAKLFYALGTVKKR